MAIPPNLIVNLTFNPPEICIIGPVRETTVSALALKLPQVCSSSAGQRTSLQFTREESPPHWYAKLPSQYCNEEMGQSQIMLTILDSLEHEGKWKLKGSNAMNHDTTKVTYKFFFVGVN
eukprot:NODE_2594_length_767_cov_464.675487_g1816_i0.p1 GENE.NODE_2594_length_767_cov_464.675487_g1816_i0~~NODE_2594_length_767_cov_464.675487_g1816_i0.p1  ORF type:complete len:119 (-),score=24.04 NODE_2594_length_767_cov_464.675487_g1816_i0:348-704(-)